METLGSRIKKARLATRPKLTQKKLAEHFGISREAVTLWESDESSPSLDKIPDLARVLNVTEKWLLNNSSSADAEPDREALTQELRAFLDQMSYEELLMRARELRLRFPETRKG